MTARARFVALAFAVAACRPALVTPSGTRAEPGACLVPAGSARADSVVIGTEGDLDPATFAVRPRTPADSLAFAQMYETLVRVACDGTLVPGLAEGWRGDSTGRAWTLFIRPDAVFHDGTPVTVEHVASAWRERSAGTGLAGDPRLLAVERVTLDSEHTLTVHLRDAHPGGPRLLADPYYAVHGQNSGFTAPVGTGTYGRLIPGDPPGGAGTRPTTIAPSGDASASPVIELRAALSGDVRDLIDRGVDVLLTADRSVIDYAATRPELRAQTLPADRAYVLLSTARDPGDRAPLREPVRPGSPAGFIPPQDPRWDPLRSALARDVLRQSGDQRADRWWISEAHDAGCALDAPAAPHDPVNPRTLSRRRSPPRLVYPAGDPLAAAIASRLVALATERAPGSPQSAVVRELLPELATQPDGPLVATPSSEAVLAASLRNPADLAYLLPVSRHALDPCAAWRAFAARAPWVAPSRIALIVEARRALITTPRSPALLLDWNNMIRVVPPRARGPASR